MRPENEHFRGQNTGERPIRTRQELWEEIGRLRRLVQDVRGAQAAQFERSLGKISAYLERHIPSGEELIRVVRVKDLEIDLAEKEVKRAGERVHFTPQEFSVIEVLVQNQGRTVNREDILEALGLGPYLGKGSYRNVYVQISHIRKKLGDDASNPAYIKTVHGQGFRLLAD